MTHRYSFTSVSVLRAINDAAEAFLPAGDAAYGMTAKDCVALAQLQVNRFLTDAPEYSDATESAYKFALAKGNKADKRAEWKRTEKSAGGIRLDAADSGHALGNQLGWFDQHIRAIEKSLGDFTVELPPPLFKGLETVWTAALKQRAARTLTPA